MKKLSLRKLFLYTCYIRLKNNSINKIMINSNQQVSLKMKIIYACALFAFMFLFGFSLVNAEDSANTDDARKYTKEMTQKEPMKPRLINMKEGIDRANNERPSFINNLKERANNLRNKKDRINEEVEEKKADSAEKRQDMQEKLAERKAERQQKLNERAKERITAYVEKIVIRLNAALDRLEKIVERMNSRIAKLEEKFAGKGLDLSEAKGLLDIAINKISTARENVSKITDLTNEALGTENPKESFGAVREIIQDASSDVKDAHKALVEAIKAIKAKVETKPSSTDDAQEPISDSNDEDN